MSVTARSGLRARLPAFFTLILVFALLAGVAADARAQGIITSLTRMTPSAETTSSDTLVWALVFSEDVTGVTTGDFSVTDASNAAITGVTVTVGDAGDSDAATYTLTAGGDLTINYYNGVARIVLNSGHGILDEAGDALADTALTALGAAAETYTVDNRPIFSTVTISDSSWTVGQTLEFVLTTNEPVTGFTMDTLGIINQGTGTIRVRRDSFLAESSTVYKYTFTLLEISGEVISIFGVISANNQQNLRDTDGTADRLRPFNAMGVDLNLLTNITNIITETVILSLSADSVNEGDTTMLTATLGSAVGTDTTVTIMETDPNGSATLSATTLTIPANMTEATTPITITTVADADSDDETVTFSATASGGTTNVSNSPLILTINDNAVLLVLSQDDPIPEGGSATLTATLREAVTDATIITVAADPAAAVTLSPMALTIPANTTASAMPPITLTAAQDDDSADAMVTLTATATGGVTAVSNSPLPLTITDDEMATLPTPPNQTWPAGQMIAEVTLPAVVAPPGDAGNVTYTLTRGEGAFIPGLAFDANSRVLSGTPTAAGTTTLTYTATDNMGTAALGDDEMIAERMFTVTIELVLAEATGALAGALDGGALRFDDLPVTLPAVVAGAISLTITYTLTRNPDGALPAGLTFDGESRVLSVVGTAQARGRAPLLYTATDPATMATVTRALVIGDDPARRAQRLTELFGAIGRTLGWDMAETIRERAQQDHRTGAAAPLRVSGISSVTSLDELATSGASFEMALNAADGGGGSPAGHAWAKVSHSEFDNEPLADYAQDGELTSVHAGVDFRSGGGRLFGAALGWHDAEVEYDDREAGIAGDLEWEMLTINPYTAQTIGRWHAWGTIGFGAGDLTVSEGSGGNDEVSAEADATLWSAAAGLEYAVATLGAVDFTARGEAMAVNLETDESDNPNVAFGKFQTDAYGVRGEVEAGLPIERPNGALRPYALMGVRWDGGADGADGFTAEYGGGVSARNRDLFVDASVRTRFAGDDATLDLTAWNLSFGYDLYNDERGLAVELTRQSGAHPLDAFGDGAAGVSDSIADPSPTLGFTTRYGADYRNGLLTPYTALRFDGSQVDAVETGITYHLSALRLGLKHTYSPATTPGDRDQHRLNLSGEIAF